jgi:flagellar biosynthesis protein FliQ
MSTTLETVLSRVAESVVGYLPNLIAGIVLIAVGWLLAWLVKRVVVRLCVVLRFDRLLRRFRWGTGFSKADVRYAFFETIGNVAFFIVFVILLKASLDALQLTTLSNILEAALLFVPRLIAAFAIAGFGWILGSWTLHGMYKALAKEGVPRATLIARSARGVVLLFFSAMALTELNIAREIVIIGFSVTIVTLGALAIVLTAVGGRTFVSKILESLDD